MEKWKKKNPKAEKKCKALAEKLKHVEMEMIKVKSVTTSVTRVLSRLPAVSQSWASYDSAGRVPSSCRGSPCAGTSQFLFRAPRTLYWYLLYCTYSVGCVTVLCVCTLSPLSQPIEKRASLRAGIPSVVCLLTMINKYLLMA